MPPTSLLPTFRERTPLLQAFQLFHGLFGLAHHVAHNLGCGFDVVHQTTRLASIEHRIVDVPCEATQRTLYAVACMPWLGHVGTADSSHASHEPTPNLP